VTGREDDDRDVDPVPAQASQHFEAVQARQPHVEDEQVEGTGRGQRPRLATVTGDRRAVTTGPQALVDEARQLLVVLGDEDGAHGPSGPSAVPGCGPSDPACSPTGRTRAKTAPRPGSPPTSTRPPCPSAMARTIASPRPAPPWRRPSGGSPCAKR